MTTPASLWDAYPVGTTWQVPTPPGSYTTRTIVEITPSGEYKYTSDGYPGVTFISTASQWLNWVQTATQVTT
jgi:hypothetical protein